MIHQCIINQENIIYQIREELIVHIANITGVKILQENQGGKR